MPDTLDDLPTPGHWPSPVRRGVGAPRWGLLGAWLVTLAVAVAISTWAVGLASRQVGEPVSPRVVLGAGPDGEPGGADDRGGVATSPTTVAPSDATPTPTDQSTARGDEATPRPGEPTTAATAATRPSPSAPPDGAAATTRTVEVVGGRASFRFEDGHVTLLWATPAPGFDVDTDEDDDVDVRFRSDDHESRIRARYEDGSPTVEVEERPDDG